MISEFRIHEPLLRLADVGVRYGQQVALREVSLDVWPGDILAFIGPNGAGKSTLLKAILGLVPLSSGVLRRSTPAVSKHIGYVPQSLAMDPSFPLTVGEFMTLHDGQRGFWAGGIPQRRRAAIESALERLHAQDLIGKQIGALSGGQLQRVLLAAAMLHEPKLLLLDEPASGIDRRGTEDLLELLSGIHAETDLTILFVSHDLHFVHRLATRVGCLNQSFCGLGTPQEVLHEHFLRDVFGPSFAGVPFHPSVVA